MRFSQKIGKTAIREILQIDSIDDRLENRLWNEVLDLFYTFDDGRYLNDFSDRDKFVIKIWTEFYILQKDTIPTRSSGIDYNNVMTKIKSNFITALWFHKYDFIEYLSKFSEDFTDNCNGHLQSELSGYRILNNSIVRITDEAEIQAIEEAIQGSSKWISVETHLKTAISFYANRDNPDYRNSVKEAISAVESFCTIINGKEATLGAALAKIDSKFKIHGAMKKAFSSLYGYTSDSGGIRHSLLEDDIEVTMEDAKFMLVSCSAFINYLKVKMQE